MFKILSLIVLFFLAYKIFQPAPRKIVQNDRSPLQEPDEYVDYEEIDPNEEN